MQVIDMLRFDAAVGMGTWKFVDDATGNYQEYTDLCTVQTTYTYALKDLFVGDMPQTGFALGATLTPMSGLKIQATMNYYDKNYYDWSPDAREMDAGGEADRAQVPSYSYQKVDLHVNYDLPEKLQVLKCLLSYMYSMLLMQYMFRMQDHSQLNTMG